MDSTPTSPRGAASRGASSRSLARRDAEEEARRRTRSKSEEPEGAALAFDELIAQAWRAHDLELRRARQEVEVLRRQLRPQPPDGGEETTSRSLSPPSVAAAKTNAEHACFADPALEVETGDTEESQRIGEDLTEGLDANGAMIKAETKSSRARSAGDTVRIVSSRKTAQRGLSNTLQSKTEMQEALRGKGSMWKFVNKPAFEIFFSLLITANAFLMAAEAQYEGFTLAEWTGHGSASGHKEDVWPHAKSVFEMLQMFFGIMFFIEIILKIIGLRIEFVTDYWNLIDLTIVVLWLYEKAAVRLPINAQLLRLARLARLLRIIRLVRFMQSHNFDSLYLMTTALKGSVSILTWTIVILLIMHMLLALLINQILRETFFVEASAPNQARVYEYFGSFSRSLLTMFELTLANWPTASRVMVEEVHELWFIYAVAHKMMLGFAVIGVINGVFIQETFNVAKLDNVVMVRQTLRKARVHESKMHALFTEADRNNDGRIDLDEWKQVCQDEWVKIWLASQDLDVRDAEALFGMLDDGDGIITSEELIRGVARLKGPAGSMDLLKLMEDVRAVIGKVHTELKSQSSMLSMSQSLSLNLHEGLSRSQTPEPLRRALQQRGEYRRAASASLLESR